MIYNRALYRVQQQLIIGIYPKPASVSFDDRPTDGQAHPQTR